MSSVEFKLVFGKIYLMKKQHLILLSTILVSSGVFVFYQTKDRLPTVGNNQKTQTTEDQERIVTEVPLAKLSVLNNRCRGCGKCTKVDPSHFEMNRSTQKAMVISTDNLDSTALAQAINICPEGAIVLE